MTKETILLQFCTSLAIRVREVVHGDRLQPIGYSENYFACVLHQPQKAVTVVVELLNGEEVSKCGALHPNTDLTWTVSARPRTAASAVLRNGTGRPSTAFSAATSANIRPWLIIDFLSSCFISSVFDFLRLGPDDLPLFISSFIVRLGEGKWEGSGDVNSTCINGA